MTTLRTTLRSVPGIDFDDRKAEICRFVLQELFELVECPRIGIAILLFAARGMADTVKLFNREDRVSGLLGEVNDTTANDVVGVSHESCFFPAQPFQSIPDTACALRCLLPLERCTSFQIAVTNMFDSLTAKELRALAVRGDSQIVNPTKKRKLLFCYSRSSGLGSQTLGGLLGLAAFFWLIRA